MRVCVIYHYRWNKTHVINLHNFQDCQNQRIPIANLTLFSPQEERHSYCEFDLFLNTGRGAFLLRIGPFSHDWKRGNPTVNWTHLSWLEEGHPYCEFGPSLITGRGASLLRIGPFSHHWKRGIPTVNWTHLSWMEEGHPYCEFDPSLITEGSRNLPQWWSPRPGHGAVLAASKPLQVSKYVRGASLLRIGPFSHRWKRGIPTANWTLLSWLKEGHPYFELDPLSSLEEGHGWRNCIVLTSSNITVQR